MNRPRHAHSNTNFGERLTLLEKNSCIEQTYSFLSAVYDFLDTFSDKFSIGNFTGRNIQ